VSMPEAWSASSASQRPSRKVRLLPEMAGMRSPGTTMPTRLSGSAAAITMRSRWHGAGACAGRAAIRLRRAARTAHPESHRQSVTAHLAAIFQATVADLQFAPARQIGFAGEQIAEDDAVAAQQHPAAGFDAAVAIGTLGVEERQRPGA